MLPRAAQRPRAGACTLESSLRCLRTSDRLVLRGVMKIRQNRPPPGDAGPALPEPASAYPEAHATPGCPEAPSRCLHPGVLPPLHAHLGSSCSPWGVENSTKSTSPRRCWTGAARAGICLHRGAHAAPGCPEAQSRRLHPGVLPPLHTHLGSSCSPWVMKIRHNRPPPGDAGPALPEPASAYTEARMLPRAAQRPRAGACTLESSLRCLRTSDRLVLRGVMKIRKNRPPPGDAGPAS